MNERNYSNKIRPDVPFVFVDAFVNDHPDKDDPVLTADELDEIFSQINQEYLTRTLRRRAFIEIMNA